MKKPYDGGCDEGPMSKDHEINRADFTQPYEMGPDESWGAYKTPHSVGRFKANVWAERHPPQDLTNPFHEAKPDATSSKKR